MLALTVIGRELEVVGLKEAQGVGLSSDVGGRGRKRFAILGLPDLWIGATRRIGINVGFGDA